VPAFGASHGDSGGLVGELNGLYANKFIDPLWASGGSSPRPLRQVFFNAVRHLSRVGHLLGAVFSAKSLRSQAPRWLHSRARRCIGPAWGVVAGVSGTASERLPSSVRDGTDRRRSVSRSVRYTASWEGPKKSALHGAFGPGGIDGEHGQNPVAVLKKSSHGGAARKPRAVGPALLRRDRSRAPFLRFSPVPGGHRGLEQTACSTLLEAASRASMARPFTTVA